MKREEVVQQVNTVLQEGFEVDAAALGEALTAIREQLETVRAMKVQLTSIGSTAGQVTAALDRMREVILAQIIRAERELVSVAA